MSDEEQRYEAIEIIAKSPREDGQDWFDYLFDLISKDCTGSETEPCTCGMEHMSGSGGTLQQCYDWTTTVGHRLQPIHLARAIRWFNKNLDFDGRPEDIEGVIEWAESEIRFDEKWENWTPEDEEEE